MLAFSPVIPGLNFVHTFFVHARTEINSTPLAA